MSTLVLMKNGCNSLRRGLDSGGSSLLNYTSSNVLQRLATQAHRSKSTAILMLNMGGPSTLDEVHPFLHRLFTDSDIIKLPVQSWLGPFIAKRRTEAIQKKYSEIGGGSPILKWTNKQGSLITTKLDQLSPETGPHKHYVGFRYAQPLLEDTLDQIEKDGVTDVIALSQYAQYCCNTSGSSFNVMAKHYRSKGSLPPYRLTIIDRWPINDGLVSTFAKNIEQELAKVEPSKRDQVLLLFTAHSLPLKSVNVGDTYTMEVAATVMQVMKRLNFSHPYRLVWQSKVGPMPWQGPPTIDSIKSAVKKGYKNLMLIPIAFVNEHIETLHELDIEYGEDLVKELPSVERILRCPAPNDHPDFIDGLVKEIMDHTKSGRIVSPQLLTQCPLCEKDVCQGTRQWLRELNNSQQQRSQQQ